MADFLLELFSEEIPARMQQPAIEHIQKYFLDWIKSNDLSCDKLNIFSTPRRLAITINGLPFQTPSKLIEVKGPKTSAPQAALDGFVNKHGSSHTNLQKRGIGKDEAYFLIVSEPALDTSVLMEAVVESMLSTFSWPKSMRWGSGETAWVRPLHNILCIFDGKVVPVEFAGVTANNKTFGHRFLAPAEIIISDVKQYEGLLEKAFVIANRDTRKNIIATQSKNIADTLNLAVLPDAKLLEEVVGLVEYPVVLLGKIDDDFMDLPPEVLTMVMRAHQKYFCLVPSVAEGSSEKIDPSTHEVLAQDKETLSPYFLITSNLQSKDGGAAIIEGNQRVLRARFADGRFFWDQDRKTPLSQFAERLKTVTYHAKLGTVADKVARVEKIASSLREALATKQSIDGSPRIFDARDDMTTRAAQLCKTDLVSGMVGEFAELQGIMGRYYAIQQGEPQAVADAIRDHYKPQGPTDSVPNEAVAICVALADKLDTLISMFAIGEKPTGSKDPFALRRAALGVIRIILDNNLRLPLAPLFAHIPLKEIALHKTKEKLIKQTDEKLEHPERVGKYMTVNETACSDIPEDAQDKLVQSLLEFFHDRLIVQLKELGMRHDVIKAVIANGDDDLVRIVNRAKALQDFLSSEDGKNLLAGYKRAANILNIEEKKDGVIYKAADLDTKKLSQTEEVDLGIKLMSVHSPLDVLRHSEQYGNAMSTLAELRPLIDAFFEKIMVNCEDKKLRINRLLLLSSIKDCMDSIADFSKIEG